MHLAYGFIGLFVLASSAASADGLTVPHTFSNGQVADATEVNGNFKALADESNENDLRIGSLEGGKFTTPFLSLSNNDKGSYSTLFGYEAGFNLAVASEKNSAFGYRALSFNTTGNANTATGFSIFQHDWQRQYCQWQSSASEQFHRRRQHRQWQSSACIEHRGQE
jgi:hypothetical protein